MQFQNPSMVSTLRRHFWMEQKNATGVASTAKHPIYLDKFQKTSNEDALFFWTVKSQIWSDQSLNTGQCPLLALTMENVGCERGADIRSFPTIDTGL